MNIHEYIFIDGKTPQFAFFPYCNDILTLYVDGREIIRAVAHGRNQPNFIQCSVSVIAGLCLNLGGYGTFAAKSYNSISNRLVTDDTWLVYNSSLPLTDNWYLETYDDSSWRTPATFFQYSIKVPQWLSAYAFPDLAVNDTYWFINQIPLDNVAGNAVNMSVYYRLKLNGRCIHAKSYRIVHIIRVYANCMFNAALNLWGNMLQRYKSGKILWSIFTCTFVTIIVYNIKMNKFIDIFASVCKKFSLDLTTISKRIYRLITARVVIRRLYI